MNGPKRNLYAGICPMSVQSTSSSRWRTQSYLRPTRCAG